MSNARGASCALDYADICREDADNRVLALKARMEALKKKREAKKAKASG